MSVFDKHRDSLERHETMMGPARGRLAVALDLLTGAYWMDVRAKQDPRRSFGAVPAAVRHALRLVVPLDSGTALPARPNGVTALDFMRTHPAAVFTGRRP